MGFFHILFHISQFILYLLALRAILLHFLLCFSLIIVITIIIHVYPRQTRRSKHSWITKGKTYLIGKDPQKGTTHQKNYRPIMCLLMMWKILTAQIKERNLLFAKKLGIFTQRTERMLQDNKRNRLSTIHQSTHPQGEQNKMKNVDIAWIDYKEANNIFTQSWIIDCLKMDKISDKIQKFIMEAMKNWKV